MELSKKSLGQIFKYILSTDAFRGAPASDVASHLAKLMKYEQIDAMEDVDGNLVYAIGWYKVSDKAFEDIKRGIPPRRFNRGPNMVGVFALFPQDVGVSRMRHIIKRAIKIERASRLHIYNSQGRWLTYDCDRYVQRRQKRPSKRLREVFKILGGIDSCHQQSV